MALEPKSRYNYNLGYNAFLAWLRDRSSDASKATTFKNSHELDLVLSRFLNDIYHDAEGKVSHANGAVFGLEHLFPELKGMLPRSRQSLTAWRKRRPGKSRPPLDRNLAYFLAMRFARAGRLDLCLAVLLSFVCMLRVSELARLRTEDIFVPGDGRIGSAQRVPLLRLGKTKTLNELSADVDDPFVAALLVWFKRDRCRPGKYVFAWSSSTVMKTRIKAVGDHFREAIHAECRRCGLSKRYTPHCLRHGGASYRMLCGASIEQVMLLGRWASSTSARRYIQKARALELAAKIPPRVARAAAVIERNPVAALRVALSQ